MWVQIYQLNVQMTTRVLHVTLLPTYIDVARCDHLYTFMFVYTVHIPWRGEMKFWTLNFELVAQVISDIKFARLSFVEKTKGGSYEPNEPPHNPTLLMT